MTLQKCFSDTYSTREIKRASSPGDQIFILVGENACEINSHKVGYWQIMISYLCHKTLTYEMLGDTFWKNGWIKIVSWKFLLEISVRESYLRIIISETNLFWKKKKLHNDKLKLACQHSSSYIVKHNCYQAYPCCFPVLSGFASFQSSCNVLDLFRGEATCQTIERWGGCGPTVSRNRCEATAV